MTTTTTTMGQRSSRPTLRLLYEPMILALITVQRGRFAPPAAASDPTRTWSAPPSACDVDPRPPQRAR